MSDIVDNDVHLIYELILKMSPLFVLCTYTTTGIGPDQAVYM